MDAKKVILICGDDEFLVNRSAKRHVDARVPPDQREFGLEVIDGNVTKGEDVLRVVQQCVGSVRTPSFFGGCKVTWLRDAAFFVAKGKAREEDDEEELSGDVALAVEKLAALVREGIPDEQVLIVSARKVPKTSAFFKACQKAGAVEDFGSGLPPWEQEAVAARELDNLIREMGIQFVGEARMVFQQRAGTDMRTLVSELEKLALYVGKDKKATVEDVNTITSLGRETMAWDLLDAVDSRDGGKTLRVLAGFEGQKGITMMLEAMLENNIRDMIILREAVDRKWIVNGAWASNIPPEAGVLLGVLPVGPGKIKGGKLTRLLGFVRNWTMMELRVARYRLMDMREKLVSGSTVPEMLLLQETLLKIIRKK
ncbi:MAG: hypothetical protein J5985_09680 [Kiritimatiellae bacterium]|nr:hypothetical protein [Kiritimatiellia bacterium]